MRKKVFRTLAVLHLLLSSPAFAQRTYTWEEACRMGGQTTGACAPKQQQQAENSDVCQRREQQVLGFHSDPIPPTRKATIADWMDMEVFVELMGGGGNADAINSLGLVMCREPGTGNGFAYIEQNTKFRILAFDPEWARAINPESYLVIAHEAGHHFCQHDSSDSSRSAARQRELEADRFSGAALRRFETYHGKRFIDASLEAGTRLYKEAADKSHPSRDERIAAIKQGYDSGSPCGNFAPAERGPDLYER